jgi:hypothetical protein
MPVTRYYSSTALPTTLASGISAGSATMTVAATTGFPASFPYTLAVDDGAATLELVEVTNASGPTLTITRGVDGTSAQSHSSGAVVRHDASARDFADSRVHEAATSDVHGVTGALVGASSTQTLANKTLTSPIVNSGALSGTFTGNPVFSGNITANGTAALAAGGSLAGTFTGSPTLSGSPVFSGAPSFTGGALFQRALATNPAMHTNVTADAQDRHQVQASGKHLWGDGATTLDTTLYRSGVGQLKTDTDLVVAGSLTAGNMALGAWSSWSPTWATSTGLHTPSFGNAAQIGAYAKIGRTLHFSYSVTFGSTTNFGAGVVSDNWLFSLPGILAASSNFTTGQLICGYGQAANSAGATAPFVVRADSGGTNFQLLLAGGRVDGVAITNTGAMDSVTPWTWASTMSLQFAGSVECTA